MIVLDLPFSVLKTSPPNLDFCRFLSAICPVKGNNLFNQEVNYVINEYPLIVTVMKVNELCKTIHVI